MDKHLADVSKSIERLAHCYHDQSDRSIDDYKEFTLEYARTLEKEIDEKVEALSVSSKNEDEIEPEYGEYGLGCDSVEKL